MRDIFYTYPPFTFSILFGIINRKASAHYDDSTMSFVPGSFFGWSDLTQPEVGEFSSGDYFASPTPLHCFGMLILIMVAYSFLTWYFDHVISDN